MVYLFKTPVAIVGATGWFEIFKDNNTYKCFTTSWNQKDTLSPGLFSITHEGRKWTHNCINSSIANELISILKEWEFNQK